MGINGIVGYYGAGYVNRKRKTGRADDSFTGIIAEKAKTIESVSEEEKRLKETDHEKVLPEEPEQADSPESKTKSDIIVKPDGSKVLVVTMSIGGTETTMSLEISKPTDTLNVANYHFITRPQTSVAAAAYESAAGAYTNNTLTDL